MQKSLSFFVVRAFIILACLLMVSAFLYLPCLSRFCNYQESINIYTWAGMFNPADIADFELQNNIKINLNYYDNCEELATKLEISKGRGYDCLLLSDCNISDLIKLDLLLPIDKTKLDFWQQLEPQILNKAYDPANLYSIPYSWDIYGIGINLAKVNNLVNSWGIIFDHDFAIPRQGMMEDGLSCVALAAQYLYGHVTELTVLQVRKIKQLLLEQKHFVEAYTSVRSDYLLSSGTSSVVVGQAACINRASKHNSQIKFYIPQEGGFISTENFVILKNSAKHELVYKFINFMCRKDVAYRYIVKTGFLPTRQDLLHEINLDYLGGKDQLLKASLFEKLAYFNYLLPRAQITNLWVEVKAS